MKKNCVYILQCADGTYYTGWTNDLPKRLHSHNAGTGAKYTRSRLPAKLVFFEVFETKEEAMRQEYAVKQLSRRAKEELIRSDANRFSDRKSRVEILHETESGETAKA